MAQESHTMTVHGIADQDTAQVHVPADVQRDEGICIDDEVDVGIHGVSDLIDEASFTGAQKAGDRITIPAQVVRQLGLVAGETYDFTFEKVEGDEEDLPGAIPDEDVTDDEDVAEAIESAESKARSSTTNERSELEEVESEQEESESEGLGELFG